MGLRSQRTRTFNTTGATTTAATTGTTAAANNRNRRRNGVDGGNNGKYGKKLNEFRQRSMQRLYVIGTGNRIRKRLSASRGENTPPPESHLSQARFSTRRGNYTGARVGAENGLPGAARSRRKTYEVRMTEIGFGLGNMATINEGATTTAAEASLTAVSDIERLAKKAGATTNYEDERFKVLPDYAYPNTRFNREELRVEMNKPSEYFHDLLQQQQQQQGEDRQLYQQEPRPHEGINGEDAYISQNDYQKGNPNHATRKLDSNIYQGNAEHQRQHQRRRRRSRNSNVKRPQSTQQGEQQIGTLSVEILQCFGLIRPEMLKETSAFCICTCGSFAFKTDVMPPVANPMWLSKMRRACIFPLYHAYARLYVGVFCKMDSWTKDGFAGRIVIDVARLRPNSTYDVTLPLRQSAHIYSRHQRGAIRLRFNLSWWNEQQALLSYIPKTIPNFKQPTDDVAIACCDVKAFQNVARVVHGVDMPGKFSMKLAKAISREINLTRIHLLRYVIKKECIDIMEWKNPFISGFVFVAWMHCVLLTGGSIRYIPGHIVTFLLLQLWRNYATYAIDEAYHHGFLPPTWEELFHALVQGFHGIFKHDEAEEHQERPQQEQTDGLRRWKKRRNMRQSLLQRQSPEERAIEPLNIHRRDPTVQAMTDLQNFANYDSEEFLDNDENSIVEPMFTLTEIGQALRAAVPTKRIQSSLLGWIGYNSNKISVFYGSDAVDVLVHGDYASSRSEAVTIGRRLQRELKLFDHITRKYDFADSELQFVFSSQRQEKASEFVVRTHQPWATKLFQFIGFSKSSQIASSAEAYTEMPYTTGKDHPRFTVRESLVIRSKGSRALLQNMQAEEEELIKDEMNELDDGVDENDASADSHASDEFQSQPSQKSLSDSVSVDVHSLFDGTNSIIGNHSMHDRGGIKKVRNGSAGGNSLRSALNKTTVYSNKQNNAAYPKLKFETKVLPKPPCQDIDVRPKKNKKITAVLAEARHQLHALTGHAFNDRVYKLSLEDEIEFEKRLQRPKMASKLDMYPSALPLLPASLHEISKKKQQLARDFFGRQRQQHDDQQKPEVKATFLPENSDIANSNINGLEESEFVDDSFIIDDGEEKDGFDFLSSMAGEKTKSSSSGKKLILNSNKDRKNKIKLSRITGKAPNLKPGKGKRPSSLASKKDEYDRALQLGKYTHSNPIMAKIAVIVQPLLEMALMWLSLFRAIYNIFTWKDPILTFWVSIFGPILVVCLHVFPYRLFLGLVGFYLVGPQNFIFRKIKENQPGYTPRDLDVVIKKKKVYNSNKNNGNKTMKPLFSSNVPDNRPVDVNSLDVSDVRQIVVPYSPLIYRRFYDWPPEPEYARVDPCEMPPRGTNSRDSDDNEYSDDFDYDDNDDGSDDNSYDDYYEKNDEMGYDDDNDDDGVESFSCDNGSLDNHSWGSDAFQGGVHPIRNAIEKFGSGSGSGSSSNDNNSNAPATTSSNGNGGSNTATTTTTTTSNFHEMNGIVEEWDKICEEEDMEEEDQQQTQSRRTKRRNTAPWKKTVKGVQRRIARIRTQRRKGSMDTIS